MQRPGHFALWLRTFEDPIKSGSGHYCVMDCAIFPYVFVQKLQSGIAFIRIDQDLIMDGVQFHVQTHAELLHVETSPVELALYSARPWHDPWA